MGPKAIKSPGRSFTDFIRVPFKNVPVADSRSRNHHAPSSGSSVISAWHGEMSRCSTMRLLSSPLPMIRPSSSGAVKSPVCSPLKTREGIAFQKWCKGLSVCFL